MADDVLFVFAHQDDEVGISTRVAYEAAAGNRVWCVYLTDGASKVPAAVRDAESVRALARLGVDRAHVVFLESGGERIADGTLMAHLARARASLGAWLAASGVRPARAYTLDWEGGHADHDATYLIVLAVARDAGIDAVWTFSMYNAYRRRPGLFRIASFVPNDAQVARRRLSLGEALRSALLIAAYPSQRRTWIGLGPGWILRALVRREERVRRAQSRRVAERPHDGPLLYSTLFRIDERVMMEQSAALRAELAAGEA